jgi:ferrochelatase
MSKIAVVLFNLGGPDSPRAVKPFLINLFNDPAILPPPRPIRWMLARYIAYRRLAEAKRIYEELGGSSPLLANTNAQAAALTDACDNGDDFSVFVAMRYWHPRAAEVAQAVHKYNPDLVVLLPLYPQFSTTTTGSSLREWNEVAKRTGLYAPTRTICCYPTGTGFLGAIAEPMAKALDEAASAGRPRILFSAHGLPARVIAKGDPYQWQIEQSAATLVDHLKENHPDLPAFDWLVTYQSRATREEWLEPDTETEIIRAGADKVPLVVVPIAFVSEHSETLVELDIQYAEVAHRRGVPKYVRVPTVDSHPQFIDGLANLVRLAKESPRPVCSCRGDRLCPQSFTGCPHHTA